MSFTFSWKRYKLLKDILAVPVPDSHPSMSGMHHVPQRQQCQPNQTNQDSCLKMAARNQTVIIEKNWCVPESERTVGGGPLDLLLRFWARRWNAGRKDARNSYDLLFTECGWAIQFTSSKQKGKKQHPRWLLWAVIRHTHSSAHMKWSGESLADQTCTLTALFSEVQFISHVFRIKHSAIKRGWPVEQKTLLTSAIIYLFTRILLLKKYCRLSVCKRMVLSPSRYFTAQSTGTLYNKNQNCVLFFYWLQVQYRWFQVYPLVSLFIADLLCLQCHTINETDKNDAMMSKELVTIWFNLLLVFCVCVFCSDKAILKWIDQPA